MGVGLGAVVAGIVAGVEPIFEGLWHFVRDAKELVRSGAAGLGCVRECAMEEHEPGMTFSVRGGLGAEIAEHGVGAPHEGDAGGGLARTE